MNRVEIKNFFNIHKEMFAVYNLNAKKSKIGIKDDGFKVLRYGYI